MRENRLYGSEGGGTELNRSSLPLSATGRRTCRAAEGPAGKGRTLVNPGPALLLATKFREELNSEGSGLNGT